jgi:glycosyltransferase involved in cell wall biosynthesis
MGSLLSKLKKFNRIRREQGMPGLRLHWRYFLHRRRERQKYQKWIEAHKLTDEGRAGIAAKIEALAHKPLISVVMPVYNVEEKWLRLCIDSVIAQLYPNWELCIADDASPSPHIRAVLDEYAARDQRIKITYRTENGHISAASNSALELATGEFTALLDHDDELAEDALYWVAAEINDHPETAMIYSDEDKIDGRGQRTEPKFKPDWSRDFLYSLNLITHLSVYRTSLLREIGGFRVGFEGSQDHDLALRVIEQISEEQIRHIPRILYHWRAIPGSVALSGEAKPYAYEKAREAIRSHFERTGVKAEVVQAVDNLHRVRYALPAQMPKVSMIFLVGDRTEAAEAIKNYSEFCGNGSEILLVCPEPLVEPVRVMVTSENIRIIPAENASEAARYNLAALHAEGDILCFMDAAIKPCSNDWLTEMAGFALQEGIGAVGAKILGSDGSVLHSGLIVGAGETIAPAHQGIPREEAGYFFRNGLINNFSAVSISALVTTRALFMEMQGFDDRNFPDRFFGADYCLRLWKKDRRVVFTPYAEFIRGEGAGKLNFEKEAAADEIAAFAKKWTQADPFYNPNLSRKNGNFEIDI